MMEIDDDDITNSSSSSQNSNMMNIKDYNVLKLKFGEEAEVMNLNSRNHHGTMFFDNIHGNIYTKILC